MRVRESNSTYARGNRGGARSRGPLRGSYRRHACRRQGLVRIPRSSRWSSAKRPGRIAELIEWGTHFDQVDGQVALTREGGHSHPRIVHAAGGRDRPGGHAGGDPEGRARPNTRIWQNSFTIDLLTHEGRCRGAPGLGSEAGPALVWARAVMLATGEPANSIVRRPTRRSPPPTAMRWPIGRGPSSATWSSCSSTRRYSTSPARHAHLLTRSCPRRGAYLRDRNGHRFMPEYHPLAELAPRRRVAGDHRTDGEDPAPQRLS